MENQENPDNLKLLSIFPNEIWVSVLNNVNNFKDYLHICDSSPFFKTTFQTLRTKVLFADVIQILHEWREYSADSRTTKELLSLRLVCSSWKFGVDKTLHHLNVPYYSELSPEFRTVNDFAKYKEPFPGNPFLTGAVRLSFVYLSDPFAFYNELLEMMGNFGHYIWYCCIEVCLPLTQTTVYLRLAKILELMPNLRRIRFRSGYNCDTELFLPEQFFPTLKHLGEVDHVRMPTRAFQELAKKNPQITRVFCHVSTAEHLQLYLTELPNLKSLSIGIKENEHFQIFHDSPAVCRLTKLTVDLKDLDVAWNSVFSALGSKFGETLQDLSIELPDPKFFTEDCRLNLPHLKNLWLHMEYPVNLDFILPAQRSLENLKICCQRRRDPTLDPEETEGVLKVNFAKNIHRSNIWEMFGKLKRLHLELRPALKFVCTREMRVNKLRNS